MKNNGVTLVELLIVIVVTGIIAAFTVVSVGNIIENTQISVDSYNVDELNSITEDYATFKGISSGDIFDGINSNEARIEELVVEGVLSVAVVAQQKGASFNWDVSNQTWELLGGLYEAPAGLSSATLTFSGLTFSDLVNAGVVTTNDSKWDTTSGNELINESGETRLFVPISKQTYTITSTAKLPDGSSGGYGVFFDTTLRNDNVSKDDGFVLQFDRGYSSGALIVRPRQNGSERGPVWVLNATDSDLIPSKSDDPTWWTDSHTIKIVVTNVDASTRMATFYLDGHSLGSYSYDNEIEGEQIYTGFRGWGSGGTEFNTIGVN